MPVVRPNECPRCGFACSAWATPRAPLSERMAVSLHHRPGFFGLGHARAAMELERMPWTCRCGARLRRKPSQFGTVEAVGVAAIGVACMIAVMACPPLVAWKFWPFGILVGLWIGFRTHVQFAIEEVEDEEARRAA